MEKLVVGENVSEIGESAFDSCSNLKDIYLSDGLLSIGKFSFRGCSTSGNDIYIPSSIQKIGNHAFMNFNIEEITIEGNPEAPVNFIAQIGTVNVKCEEGSTVDEALESDLYVKEYIK